MKIHLSLCLLFISPALTLAQESSSVVVVEPVLAISREQVETPAREAGVLQPFAVKEMAVVAAGQPLGGVDDSQAKLELAKAQASRDSAHRKATNDIKVQVAKKEYEVANREFQRADEAYRLYSGAASKSERDKKELEAQKAKLAVQQAEHEFDVAQDELAEAESTLAIAKFKVSKHQITAPMPGVIVEIHRRVGEWVEPGVPVLRILRVDRLQVEGFVDAASLTYKDVGAEAAFETADIPGVFRGKLTYVSPTVNAADHTVFIRAEIANQDLKLRPGVRGKLTIQK